MPKTYIPVDPVTCENCGISFSRRRRSTTGLYYCGKETCQDARRREYTAAKNAAGQAASKAALDRVARNSAAFMEAVLRAPRVKCSRCGLTNAIRGYGHLDKDGRGCNHLGAKVEGVTIHHALVAWPEGDRVHEVF